MRMTVNLNPDVYTFAKAYAGGKGLTLSAAINELVSCAEQATETQSFSGRLKRNEYGYLEIAETGHVITPEMVKEAAEDELLP